MAQDVLNTASFLIVIGGSAGSLDVLLHLLPDLRINAATAVVIILHRKNDTDSLLPLLLAGRSIYLVKEAEDKEPIVSGSVYIAPSDYHLLIEKNFTFSLDDSEKVNYSRPSIDVTFETAAYTYTDHLTAILLSGANADGTNGLAQVKQAGGKVVIQSPASSAMPFMPQNAIDNMLPDAILATDELAAYLNDLQAK